MKRILFFLTVVLLFIACNNETKPAEAPAADTAKTKAEAAAAAPAAPSVTLPFTAGYSSTWTDEVSDNDLLTVLNSYKYWESGDMAAARGTLGDSVHFYSWSGLELKESGDAIIKLWTKTRDSLSSVKITMDAWRKMHSVDKKADWVSVWYTEVDKYKTGKVDSAYFQDDNMLVNGKIVDYEQHKQFLKKKK